MSLHKQLFQFCKPNLEGYAFSLSSYLVDCSVENPVGMEALVNNDACTLYLLSGIFCKAENKYFLSSFLYKLKSTYDIEPPYCNTSRTSAHKVKVFNLMMKMSCTCTVDVLFISDPPLSIFVVPAPPPIYSSLFTQDFNHTYTLSSPLFQYTFLFNSIFFTDTKKIYTSYINHVLKVVRKI